MPGVEGSRFEVTSGRKPARRFRINTITLSEKFSGNDKYGTGSLVAREGTLADNRRRRRLHELVCAHGPGRRAGRKRASVGSDPIPQELDPGALRRSRSHLLAGRDAGSAPD